MSYEETILYGIGSLENSNLSSYSLGQELGTLEKIGEERYKLNCSKSLLPFQFKFLILNHESNSIEVSLPSIEECDKLTLSLSQDEKIDLNQTRTYGNELLYKLGVGLLHTTNNQKG